MRPNDRMTKNPNIYEAKWELAELRGSLFSLSRELAALRKEIDQAHEAEELAHQAFLSAAQAKEEAPRAVPVARMVYKSEPAKARKALPAKHKPPMHRLQPIRLELSGITG